MRNYFADNLRYLRKQKGLNQEELGKDLGKTKAAISLYELGQRMPVAKDLRVFANYFHVSTERLLNEDLSVVNDLDVELMADHIRAELVRMRITDKEYDQIIQYIQFLKSVRK
jgi:transcriptional regulator with XRE-family HTH domain